MNAGENKPKDETRSYRALVTGAAGCIGRCLVRRLVTEGWKVNALIRAASAFQELRDGQSPKAIRVFKGDLVNSASLDEATEGVDVVFHAAAKVHSVPRTPEEEGEFYRVNVTGTENLLRFCQRQSLRAFVFFSTIAVYGPDAVNPLRETTPCHPEGAYAASKYEAEQRVMRFFAHSETRATVLRLSLVFGEGERGNFLRMVRGIDTGRFVFVGNTRSKKSMTYVENVVEAALLVAGNPLVQDEIFNVADPSPYPLQLVVETVARQLGVSIPARHIPASFMRLCGCLLESIASLLHFHPFFTASDVRKLTSDTICDVSKIQTTLGFQPSIGLEEGIRRTVRWYREQQANLRKRH